MIDDNDHNDKIITITIVITLITLKTMILMLAGWLLHPSTPDKDFPPPELFQHCLASGEKGANSSDCVCPLVFVLVCVWNWIRGGGEVPVSGPQLLCYPGKQVERTNIFFHFLQFIPKNFHKVLLLTMIVWFFNYCLPAPSVVRPDVQAEGDPRNQVSRAAQRVRWPRATTSQQQL